MLPQLRNVTLVTSMRAYFKDNIHAVGVTLY